MKTLMRLFAALFVCSGLLFTGCDDNDRFDHDPPDGQGAMIIDNNTADDISVFLDGVELSETRDGRSKAYNLDPGIYRVVLIQQGGDRSYSEDLDILEGRLTVLDVAVDLNSIFRYDVVLFFE